MNPRSAAAVAATMILGFWQAAVAAPATPAPAAMPAPSPVAAPSPSSSAMTLTLAQAEDIALASSPVLALARGQLAQAEAGIGLARSGGLPNLTASGQTVRAKAGSSGGGSSNPSPGPSPATQSGTTLVTSTSGTLNLHQLLIDGGRVHAAVESARFSTDASRLTLQRQIQSVLFGVAQSYYAALQARHQLVTAQDSLRLAQVQERLVEAQYKAGVASRADVLTAQLPVAQAQLAVAQGQYGEQTQVATLLDTMGLPAQTSVTVTDEEAAPVALPPMSALLESATHQRPDLLAAKASYDAAHANLRSARLGLFPTISGIASDGTSATKVDTVPGTGNYANSYSLGFAVSIPLFDGGLTRAQTASAQAQADQAQANLKSSELLVSLNVQQAYLAVETAEAGLVAADAEYAQARTVLDVTNAQYRAGVTTLPLLLNAQVGLTKAEGDRVNAIYTYKTNWQQLLLAEGTIGR